MSIPNRDDEYTVTKLTVEAPGGNDIAANSRKGNEISEEEPYGGNEAGEVAERFESAVEADDVVERFESVIEAILFASGEPLPLERIASIIDRTPADTKSLLEAMEKQMRNSKHGLLLRELAGKYQLCTRPELSGYVGKLFEIRQKQTLSQAAYETLSIIAYNANVTRAFIEKVRGVNSDSPISKLLDRNLIMETGRANLPGRPMQYDVTDDFYRQFGFKSRYDLPDIGISGDGLENDEN